MTYIQDPTRQTVMSLRQYYQDNFVHKDVVFSVPGDGQIVTRKIKQVCLYPDDWNGTKIHKMLVKVRYDGKPYFFLSSDDIISIDDDPNPYYRPILSKNNTTKRPWYLDRDSFYTFQD